jgi:hypothetical protein
VAAAAAAEKGEERRMRGKKEADARKKTYKRRGRAVPNWMTTITFRFF